MPDLLAPRRHEPPPGWSAEVFEAVTAAIASALVGAYRRSAVDTDAERLADAERA